MNRKTRIAAATLTTLSVFGATAAVAFGGGSGDTVAAETAGPSTAAPASVARLAQNADFIEFGIHADQAKLIPTPSAARTSQPWYVVPADRGACLSPGDGGLVCGSPAQLKAGQIIAVDRPLPALTADGTIDTEATPSAPLRVAGLVPDGVSSVVAKDSAGKQIVQARVESNAYEIPLAGASSFGALELQRADGTNVTTLDVRGGR